MAARQKDSYIGTLIGTAIFAYGAWSLWGYEGWELEFGLLLFMAAIGGLQSVIMTLRLIPAYFERRRLMQPSDRAGSARWECPKTMRRQGLFKRKNGFLMGIRDKKPLFVDIESSGLVLSPAGGGKTSSFVIPALCHIADSMLVPDLKATLAVMTADYRKKKFKADNHQTLCVNPAGLYGNLLGVGARYNPLQILIDDWQDPSLNAQLLEDAGNIAKQLHPDPTNQGENQYFRNGARKFLSFAFVYLVCIERNATLANALTLLSDSEAIVNALNTARASRVLNGDLSRRAKDLLTKYDQGDLKQIESFREGAMQALEVFSPSGTLAECTSTCDFRFSDMKKRKLTIYLIADPTRMATYAPWLGLISWCALTELMRFQNGNSVVFLCDEVTNFKIEGLPALLTLAREFKIKLWLILQELEQWAHVYGRESLETLLSQTEVKLILGARSQKTCQLISSMLGNETIKSFNYNLGADLMDDVTTSLQEMPRALLTPDEIRRTAFSILFVRDLYPIWLEKIGFHEISPWKRKIGRNPLFKTRLKGKTRLRFWK